MNTEGSQQHPEQDELSRSKPQRQLVNRKLWTSREDNILEKAIHEYGTNWKEVAKVLNNRNPSQCAQRWKRIKPQSQRCRQQWSPAEDQQLLELVQSHKRNWGLIASVMTWRTGKQIRERFINKLNPDIRSVAWQKEEDLIILEMYLKMGSKWTEISKVLQGRPENMIKNRFYSYIRKEYMNIENPYYIIPKGQKPQKPLPKALKQDRTSQLNQKKERLNAQKLDQKQATGIKRRKAYKPREKSNKILNIRQKIHSSENIHPEFAPKMEEMQVQALQEPNNYQNVKVEVEEEQQQARINYPKQEVNKSVYSMGQPQQYQNYLYDPALYQQFLRQQYEQAMRMMENSNNFTQNQPYDQHPYNNLQSLGISQTMSVHGQHIIEQSNQLQLSQELPNRQDYQIQLQPFQNMYNGNVINLPVMVQLDKSAARKNQSNCSKNENK